jgi:hypothetical protein
MEERSTEGFPEKKLAKIAQATRHYDDVDPYTADHRDIMLQQSRVNLMAISQMSDLKANLILTLSAVLLQFALVKISDHLVVGPKDHFWVIAIGCLLTILFSAYSTLPKAPLRFHERPDDGVSPMPKNILFFTTFIPMGLAEYKRHMDVVLRTPPATHEAILEELHAHGRYISRRKYLPLRLAYFSFLLTWIVGAGMYLTV